MSKVTQFKNGKSPGNYIIRDSYDVLMDIKNGKFKNHIETLNVYERDSKDQDEYKKSHIPAIGWNGVFTYRSNDKLIEHSGLVAIDFDHIPDNEFGEYFKKLSEDKHTYALFRSPRRDGLKCIVRIPPSISEHRDYVRGLRDYYGSKYYDHFEDEARLCFVSYDPDLYVNIDACEWQTKGKSATGGKSPEAGFKYEVSDAEAISIFERLIKWEINKGNHYTDGNKHKYLVSIMSACLRFGIQEQDTVSLCFDRFGKINGVEAVSHADYVRIGRSIYSLYPSFFGTSKFTPTPKKSIEIDEEKDPEKPHFPVEIFPEDLTNLIVTLNSGLNFSKDFLSIAVLSAFATLNGNRFKLKVKNEWIAPAIFWFAAVGEPGVNKTHPIKTIMKPIHKIDSDSKVSYDQQVSELTDEERKDPTKRPKFRQIIINDYTLEALHVIHNINKRGVLLYRDELVGFLNDMNKYRKGSDEQFWLESFNNSSYIVNRVTRDPLMIEYTNINIIGTIQPEQLGIVLKDHSGNGLTDRFLYTTNETDIYPITNGDIDPGWIKWWNDLISGFNGWASYIDKEDTFIVDIDENGFSKLIELDRELCELQKSESTVYYMKSYLSKMRTYLPRFALLISVIDSYITGSQLIVSDTHIERSYKAVMYFIESAKFVFNYADKSDEIDAASVKLNGMNKAERIIELYKKGHKQTEIAKKLKVSEAYVSKQLTQVKDKKQGKVIELHKVAAKY